jgi:Ca2+-binding EF-hand superfamily protein
MVLGRSEKKLRYQRIFERFRSNEGNFIDFTSLKKVIFEMGEKCTDEEIKRIISSMDEDKDGRLSYDDFCKVMLFYN